MTLQNPQLALALIVVLSIIVLLQSAFIIIAILQLGKRLGSLHLKTGELAEKISAVMELASGALEKAAVVREKLPGWERNLSRAVETLATSTQDIDRKADRALTFLRTKVDGAHRRTDSLLSKYSATTFRVHRSIIHPSHQISAAVSAIQAGVARFIFRDRKTPQEEPDRDPMFL